MENQLNTRTLYFLLIFVVLGLYYPAIFAPVNSVDDVGMYHYLLNTDALNLRDIFFPGGKGTYYRPLLTISFLIDKYVWGLEESFMHLQNIVVHLCNALLLFAVALRAGRLLEADSPFPAFLASLFFAIHPINTESIDWLSGRTDLLASLFILISVYLLFSRTKSGIVSMSAALFLLLACLAKESAFFFLPAAFVYPFFLSSSGNDTFSLRTVLKVNMLHFVVFGAAGICYLALRTIAFTGGDEGMGRLSAHLVGGQGADLLTSIRMVLKAAGFYVKKLLIPFPLNFAIVHVSDLYMIPGVLLCVVIIFLLVNRTLPGFFLISAASLGASALMIPLIRITWTPLAERYMYIPSAFFLVGLTFAVQQCKGMDKYRKILTLVVSFLVAVSLWGTARRNLLWQDNLALFQDTRQKSPDFVPAQNEMAHALYDLGRIEEAGSIIKSMKLSEDLNNYQYGLISKSAALVNEGDTEGARKILRQLLSNPGRHEVVIIQRLLKLNDGEVLAGKADLTRFYAENVRLLTRLHTITGDPFYQYRLGQLYMFKGERAKARDAFQRVVAQATEKVYYHAPAKKLLEKMSN
jgi:tetratricopeptide (TPR) repeat protein